jgi:hypothetical protein
MIEVGGEEVSYLHSLMVRSSDPEASVLPSGEKATAWTELEWPSSVFSGVPDPDCGSHSLTVPSCDA